MKLLPGDEGLRTEDILQRDIIPDKRLDSGPVPMPCPVSHQDHWQFKY